MKNIKEIIMVSLGVATTIAVAIFTTFFSMKACIELAKLWK